eukprot:286620-Pelagomonas_calceolata.AAC.13
MQPWEQHSAPKPWEKHSWSDRGSSRIKTLGACGHPGAAASTSVPCMHKSSHQSIMIRAGEHAATLAAVFFSCLTPCVHTATIQKQDRNHGRRMHKATMGEAPSLLRVVLLSIA